MSIDINIKIKIESDENLQVYDVHGYSAVAALWNFAGRSSPTVNSLQDTPNKATVAEIHSTQETSSHVVSLSK